MNLNNHTTTQQYISDTIKYSSITTPLCEIHHTYNPYLLDDIYHYTRQQVHKKHLLNNHTNTQKYYIYNDIFSHQTNSITKEFRSSNLRSFDDGKSMKQQNIFWKSIKNQAKNEYIDKVDYYTYKNNMKPSNISQTSPNKLRNHNNALFDDSEYKNYMDFIKDIIPLNHNPWYEKDTLQDLEYITDYYILFESMNLYHTITTNRDCKNNYSHYGNIYDTLQDKLDTFTDRDEFSNMYDVLDTM